MRPEEEEGDASADDADDADGYAAFLQFLLTPATPASAAPDSAAAVDDDDGDDNVDDDAATLDDDVAVDLASGERDDRRAENRAEVEDGGSPEARSSTSPPASGPASARSGVSHLIREASRRGEARAGATAAAAPLRHDVVEDLVEEEDAPADDAVNAAGFEAGPVTGTDNGKADVSETNSTPSPSSKPVTPRGDAVHEGCSGSTALAATTAAPEREDSAGSDIMSALASPYVGHVLMSQEMQSTFDGNAALAEREEIIAELSAHTRAAMHKKARIVTKVEAVLFSLHESTTEDSSESSESWSGSEGSVSSDDSGRGVVVPQATPHGPLPGHVVRSIATPRSTGIVAFGADADAAADERVTQATSDGPLRGDIAPSAATLRSMGTVAYSADFDAATEVRDACPPQRTGRAPCHNTKAAQTLAAALKLASLAPRPAGVARNPFGELLLLRGRRGGTEVDLVAALCE